jgi:hypothetical protein
MRLVSIVEYAIMKQTKKQKSKENFKKIQRGHPLYFFIYTLCETVSLIN